MVDARKMVTETTLKAGGRVEGVRRVPTLTLASLNRGGTWTYICPTIYSKCNKKQRRKAQRERVYGDWLSTRQGTQRDACSLK